MADKISKIKVGSNTYDVAVPEGYVYAGIAHKNDASFTPTQNSFWIASEAGTYTNYGGLAVAEGEVAILKYNALVSSNNWSKDVTGIEKVSISQNTHTLHIGSTDTGISVSEGYEYMGVAHPDDAATTHTRKVFYLATEAGEYENYKDTNENAIQVKEGEVAFLMYYRGNTSGWYKITTSLASKGDISYLNAVNILSNIETISGGYLHRNHGGLIEYTTGAAYYTNFIPIAPNVVFLYSGKVQYNICEWAFYDGDKTFISSSRPDSQGTGEQEVDVQVTDIPSTAKYIRFSSFGAELGVKVINLTELNKKIDIIDAKVRKAEEVESIFTSGIVFDLQGYYQKNTGTFEEYNTAQSTSVYYPIVDNLDYIITAIAQWSTSIFALYDENKNLLSTYPSSGTSKEVVYGKSFRELSTIPSTAKYIRFSTLIKSSVTGYSVLIKIKNWSPKWKGIIWAAIGDSLTEVNQRTTLHYHDYIAQETGINVVNLGMSGTGYAARQDVGNAFYQRINTIPADTNVITIFGSGNDLSHLTLGEITDSGTTTLCGCINETIDEVQENFPTIPFGIIAPTPWAGYEPYQNNPNAMSLYCDAIEAICKRRGVPYLNLYYCSNLHPSNVAFRELAYSKDEGSGVHPDETGHKIIAPRIEAFLDELLLH